jgi:hypothetical protein
VAYLNSAMKFKTIILTLIFSWFSLNYTLEFEPEVSFAEMHAQMDNQQHLMNILRLRQIPHRYAN